MTTYFTGEIKNCWVATRALSPEEKARSYRLFDGLDQAQEHLEQGLPGASLRVAYYHQALEAMGLRRAP